MRLLNSPAITGITLVFLTVATSGCALLGGGRADVPDAALAAPVAAANGPQADYPMVLGEAYTVEGQEFVPADTASYDAVGYAGLDREGGNAITIAHRTLPLPSYVEVTELGSGRTILARVERRGPMTVNRLVALSRGAQAALGVEDGAPVRVRRVNPPEADRAELRAGRPASSRMDTPKSLLGVLQRKLTPTAATTPQLATSTVPKPASGTPELAAAGQPKPSGSFVETRRANGKYPLGGAPAVKSPVARQEVAAADPVATPTPAPREKGAAGEFVVQAAAFASKANADRAANKIGGVVTKAGAVYRVRTGPYATRGQAEAALAKVRAAGYSDARVFTAG